MENTSGLVPVDLRILVKPDVAADKIGSVYVPDVAKDKQKYAGTTAVFVAGGSNAFREWHKDGPARTPNPGDRVIFAQYTGAREKGADGQDYVVMNDTDLLAIIEEAQ